MKNLKKIICPLLVALFALASLSALADGTIKTTGNVNMRSGAGLEYRVIASADKGSTFNYTATAMDGRGVMWYKVSNRGQSAWISSKYATSVNQTQYVWVNGNVNIRRGAGLNYKKVGLMAQGELGVFQNEIKVDDRNVAWYKVSFKGVTGWVSSKYARIC